jgi:Protein of unknown function (DUF3040)
MSLSASEVRALTGIERALLSRDPRLRSLFSIFTRLTWQEAMPTREQIRRRRWRPQPGLVIAAALTLALAMVVLGAIVSPQRGCPTLRTGSTLVRTIGHGCPAGPSANPLR